MMQQFPRDFGWIEVICGSMYSGKTEELIRTLKRALYGKQQVQVFKPQIDNRYDELTVVSHSQLKIDATAVQRAHQILHELAPGTKVVGIDEVQFWHGDGARGAGAGLARAAPDLRRALPELPGETV